MLHSAPELMQDIAHRLKVLRLSKELTQLGLSKRSGVSLAVVRLFERTGKISLESLLKLALALGAEKDFAQLFSQPVPDESVSLDQLLERSKKRKRGRIV